MRVRFRGGDFRHDERRSSERARVQFHRDACDERA